MLTAVSSLLLMLQLLMLLGASTDAAAIADDRRAIYAVYLLTYNYYSIIIIYPHVCLNHYQIAIFKKISAFAVKQKL